jgi:hypothetical protein
VAQIKQLRIVATLLFAFAVAQAGLGSGYLDGVQTLLVAHATNAFAVLVLAVIGAIFGVTMRRSGGPSWTVFMPIAIIIALAVQMMLGFAGIKGLHVFFGVLILCTITAYCSYSWRLRLPEGGASGSGAPADR